MTALKPVCSLLRMALDASTCNEIVRFLEDHGFHVGVPLPGVNGSLVMTVVAPGIGCYSTTNTTGGETTSQ